MAAEQIFIENLTKANSDYNNPEQAITTANLCDTISKDINTDRQRFIYELIQNADDASESGDRLELRIMFIDGFLVVAHNGKSFTSVDIESISSAGDGTKVGDINKTGFKGIGFKSVFSHSNLVIIKSDRYTFGFDKSHWNNYWDAKWGDIKLWKEKRREKNKHDSLKMPWQIIPIWMNLPPGLRDLETIKRYKVSTFIKFENARDLKNDIINLFRDEQIILFLRCRNIKVHLTLGEDLLLEKRTNAQIVSILLDGSISSEWLLKTNTIDIPPFVRQFICDDEKSPKKLRESSSVDISFAVQVEFEGLKSIQKEKRLIYTYLPTSINLNLPFLVNSSFLTDAGRQHIHQDSDWNIWLFHEMPILYLEWLAELAKLNPKYSNQIYQLVLFEFRYSELEKSFSNGLKTALGRVPFIPNKQGELIKLGNALLDKTGISEQINPIALIDFLNTKKKKSFTLGSFIGYKRSISSLIKLGLTTFDVEDLDSFLGSEQFGQNYTPVDNYRLILYMINQIERSEEQSDRDTWNRLIPHTRFILDNQFVLRKPGDIYFPVFGVINEFQEGLNFINGELWLMISGNIKVQSWLENFGTKELTDLNFIESTIIRAGRSFITLNNAIAVGKLLFRAHKRGELTEIHYSQLRYFLLLTQNGSLISAKDAYLADFFEPQLRIESIHDTDVFVSEYYYSKVDLISEWKTFFIKIGVSQNISWSKILISKADTRIRRDSEYFSPIITFMDGKREFSNYGAYSYHITEFEVSHYSFLDYVTTPNFAKLFWKEVFSSIYIPNGPDIVNGMSGFYPISHKINEVLYGNIDYFSWTIQNLELIPTLNGQLVKASGAFLNLAENIELAANYLPVIDYDGIIPENWIRNLKLRKQLLDDDLLSILTLMWIEQENNVVVRMPEKSIVAKIYSKLIAEQDYLSEKLKNWGKFNKILSKDGKSFHYPKDLYIVTIEGFNAPDLVYTENQRPESVDFFRILGVQIIDKVTPKWETQPRLNSELKLKLNDIAPLIALISGQKNINENEWEIEFDRISKKIKELDFYDVDELFLSYGNMDDLQKGSYYAEEGKVYISGNWRSPRKIDFIADGISSILNLKDKSRMLGVLLLESFSEGIEFLNEKGYDTRAVRLDHLNSSSSLSNEMNLTNRPYNISDEAIGRKGEMFLFEYLKEHYKSKYYLEVIETYEGFKIGEMVEVWWINKNENTTENHDFMVNEFGKDYYIECKSTTYGKNVEKVALYISSNELNLMESSTRYLIARVYNIGNPSQTEVEFIQLTKKDL